MGMHPMFFHKKKGMGLKVKCSFWMALKTPFLCARSEEIDLAPSTQALETIRSPCPASSRAFLRSKNRNCQPPICLFPELAPRGEAALENNQTVFPNFSVLLPIFNQIQKP